MGRAITVRPEASNCSKLIACRDGGVPRSTQETSAFIRSTWSGPVPPSQWPTPGARNSSTVSSAAACPIFATTES